MNQSADSGDESPNGYPGKSNNQPISEQNLAARGIELVQGINHLLFGTNSVRNDENITDLSYGWIEMFDTLGTGSMTKE